eukprot:363857-Chlamydomonas_euryale.AAC.11
MRRNNGPSSLWRKTPAPLQPPTSPSIPIATGGAPGRLGRPPLCSPGVVSWLPAAVGFLAVLASSTRSASCTPSGSCTPAAHAAPRVRAALRARPCCCCCTRVICKLGGRAGRRHASSPTYRPASARPRLPSGPIAPVTSPNAP